MLPNSNTGALINAKKITHRVDAAHAHFKITFYTIEAVHNVHHLLFKIAIRFSTNIIFCLYSGLTKSRSPHYTFDTFGPHL